MKRFYSIFFLVVFLVACQQSVPEENLEPLNGQDKPQMNILEGYLPQ